MRISDWSSDVCSSDLVVAVGRIARRGTGHRQLAAERRVPAKVVDARQHQPVLGHAGGHVEAVRQAGTVEVVGLAVGRVGPVLLGITVGVGEVDAPAGVFRVRLGDRHQQRIEVVIDAVVAKDQRTIARGSLAPWQSGRATYRERWCPSMYTYVDD